MSDPGNGLAARTFRTNPRYELVLFDRLEEHERNALAELRAQRGFYGIVRERAPAKHTAGQQSLRAVDRETALLLLTLQEPGGLPAYVRDADPACDGIRRLVLEGVVEIQNDGTFVGGAEAAALLSADDGAGCDRPSRLARISLEAVEYGAALALDDRASLAMRLYAYNRLPLSASHAASYPDAASILDFVTGGSPFRTTGWSITSGAGGHWISFSRMPAGRGSRRNRSQSSPASYKLYVSPLPHALPDAFCELQDALIAHHVSNFKTAGTAGGMLRPDKLVAYFDDQETLLAVGHYLENRLRGAPAQGVPFTATIDAEGLLSWGVDPPAEARPLSWQPQQSWRSWITSALAGSLTLARQNAGELSSARFAVQRLALEGVDVNRWAPLPTLWRTAAG
jgi:hypothetical protein